LALCLTDRDGVASVPRPDRVYYKPMAPMEYVGIVDEMMAPPEDPLRPAQRLGLAPTAGFTAALCAPSRQRQFRWRRGSLGSASNAS
jgi:hypothetical protein